MCSFPTNETLIIVNFFTFVNWKIIIIIVIFFLGLGGIGEWFFCHLFVGLLIKWRKKG